MRKNSVWVLIGMIWASVGCMKEDTAKNGSAIYRFNATAEELNPATRVGFDLNADAKFFWTYGDAIAVGTGSPHHRYTTDTDTGSPTAAFTGTGKMEGYAVYPYERVQVISGDQLTYEYASEYVYDKVDTDFFSGISVDIPMWAEIESTDAMFRHLGGIIAFKFPDLEQGNDQTFTVKSEQKIAGTFTVDLSSTDVPEITTYDTENEAESKVTIRFSLSETQDAVFYIPVPVGTYAIAATLKNGDKEYTMEVRGLTVIRTGIRYTTIAEYNLEGGTEE